MHTWAPQEWVQADRERMRQSNDRHSRITLCLWQAGNQQHAACAERVNRIYAAKQGYQVLLVSSEAVDLEGRVPYWGKVKALQACMHSASSNSLVVYLDSDALIIQQHIDIQSLLRPDIDFHLADHGLGDKTWGKVNTGVLIFKNTEWSNKFLAHWWAAGADTPYISAPFHEQSVLQHVLEEGMFDCRQKTVVYPAHIFNTAIHPTSQDETARGFILHMMGSPPEDRKAQCMRLLGYLRQAQVTWWRE